MIGLCVHSVLSIEHNDVFDRTEGLNRLKSFGTERVRSSEPNVSGLELDGGLRERQRIVSEVCDGLLERDRGCEEAKETRKLTERPPKGTRPNRLKGRLKIVT